MEEGKARQGRGASTGAVDNQEEEGKHGAVTKHSRRHRQGRGDSVLSYQRFYVSAFK